MTAHGAVVVGPRHQVAGADEAGGEDRGGVLVDVLRRAALLDHAAVHDRDPVTHAQRLVLVVGDEQEGDPDLALDRLQLEPASAWRSLRSRAASGSSSSSTFGRLIRARARATRCRWPPESCERPVLGAVGRAARARASRRRAGRSRPVDPLAPEAEADVAAHVEVLEEGVALEDGVDVALVRGSAGHVLAADQDRAGGGVVEARDHPQGRGLAASRRAEEGEELATADVEVEGVDHGRAAEDLGQPAQGDGVLLTRRTACGRRGRCLSLGGWGVHRRSPPVMRSRLDDLRLNSRGSSRAATISSAETASIRVPTALMAGETPNRIEE